MSEKQFRLKQTTEKTLSYKTPNGTVCKTTPNILVLVENDLNRLCTENNRIHQIINEAYNNERTALGKSVLKQLMERIE
jgi:hypothetical protein